MDPLHLSDLVRLLRLIPAAVTLALITLCGDASPETFEVLPSRSYYTTESSGKLVLLSFPSSPTLAGPVEAPVEAELLLEDEVLTSARLPDRGRRLTLPFSLARLPLEIRGFGPVKMKNETKAAKRREELLAVIRHGGTETARAAE